MSGAVKAGYKQTEVGVIPDDWEVTSLGNLSQFVTSGSRGWAQYYADHGSLFVRSQNVRDGRLDFEDCQFVAPPKGAEGDRTKLCRRDLLITITGNSVGNVALVQEDLGSAYISQHVGLVRLGEPSSAQYVCRYLAPGSPGNKQIRASQSGQSKPGLTLTNLRDFLVTVPSEPEQRAIATALSDVDALLTALDQLIAKKRNLKQATMQQLLTGQTRLPGFSGGWEVRRLGDVATFRTGPFGSALHKSDYTFDGIPIINPMHIIDGQILASRNMTITEAAAVKLNEFRVKVGEIVIGRRGDMGRCAIVTPAQDGWLCGTGSMIVRPTSGVDAGFLQRVLSSPPIISAIVDTSVGTTMVNLNQGTLSRLTLQFPPVPEQQAISTLLSDLDAELAALEQRRHKTRALKQGMMQELLTGRTRLL